MEKHLLSKSTFIRGSQCLKSLYLHKRRPFLRDRLSAEQLAKFRRGTKVGILAQQLFPGGTNLQPKSPSQYKKAVAATAEHITTHDDFIIYEASFQSDQVLIILDVLERKNGKVYAYEVKSSLSISDTYLKDAALQYHVIKNAGIEIEDFFIVYMNKDYVLDNESQQLDLQQLFITESVLPKVLKRQSFIEYQIPKAKEALFLKHSPEIPIGPQCHSPYPCDFMRHCWKHISKNSIFDLDFLSEEQKFDLYSKKVVEISEIENQILLSDLDQKLLTSHLTDQAYLDKDQLSSFFEGIDEPHFIRLSCTNDALPRWKGHKPYEFIPLHFSITNFSNDKTDQIISFTIHPSTNAPTQELASKMIQSLPKNSLLVCFKQEEILRTLPEINDHFSILDLSKIFKNYTFYHAGINPHSTLKIINNKLLKTKEKNSILSDLQNHQKLNEYLETKNIETAGILKEEITLSGVAEGQILAQLFNYFKGLIS